MTLKPWKYSSNVPEKTDIPNQSLFQMFNQTVDQYGDRPAAAFKGKQLTYNELMTDVSRLANGLKSLSIQKGDRVAILIPNCPQYIISFFAIMGVGGIATSISPLYTADEIHVQLANSGSKIILTLDLFLEEVRKAVKDTDVEYIIVSSIADALAPLKSFLYRKVIGRKNARINPNNAIKELSYSNLIKSQSKEFVPTQVDPTNDLACLQYTGGTTGVPKGAMLTHRNLFSQVIGIDYWVGWNENITLEFGNEVVIGALPFSHIFGSTTSLLWGTHIGANVILIPDPRKLEELLSDLTNYKVTFFNGVPTLFLGLANHPNIKNYDLSTLKACISGGSSLPESISERFEAVANTTVVEGFGLSEASPVTHVNPLNPERRKPGTIGIPFINTEAKLVDMETKEEISEFQENGLTREGMLYVRGPQLMKGYWNAPEETNLVLTNDGWLKTGDIVVMDTEGYFIFMDRSKDLINVSGYKVWPTETEKVLYRHEAVEMVAVIPTLDPHSGEAVKAIIVPREGHPKPSLNEIRSFCKGKIAPYKIPHYLEYKTELPLSPVGKVLRRVLKEEEYQKCQQGEVSVTN